MPPILEDYFGLRFYVTSHDMGEPIHIHVGRSEKDSGNMKVWITDSGAEIETEGTTLSKKEIKHAMQYIVKNRSDIISGWIDLFHSGETKHEQIKRLHLD